MELLIDYYPILGTNIWGNSLAGWLGGLLVFAIAFGALKVFRKVGIVRLKQVFEKTENDIDDIIIQAIDSIYWPFYVFASLFIAIHFVNLPEVVSRWIFNIFIVIVIYYVIKFLAKVIDYGTGFMMAQKDNQQDTSILKLLSVITKILLWIGAVVLIMANLGYNVTSLIAGLGIGGIAVGLALQKILGDLFSSLAIYLDKPFQIGDFIVVDNYMGTVTKVGIKTTRIQALQGEEIVMSNSDLTGSRVQNFGKMEKRRIVFDLGVTYSTPADKLEKIPEIIKQTINKQDKTEFDRCHFKLFGDFALVYETVYYLASPDYNEYMDTQQSINLAIVKQFEAAGLDIAYPTQTIHLKKDQ